MIIFKYKYTYISFPIKDRSVPKNNIEFSKFIIKLEQIIFRLKNNQKMTTNRNSLSLSSSRHQPTGDWWR